jgi:anti-sigma B factor antagonist
MEDTGLDITVSSLVECEVIEVDGELDCQTAPELQQALQHASTDGRPVVVDLSRLRFIDSSGLHILMSGADADSEDGRRIVVCPPGNVARVLSIVRAEAALSIYEDLEKALASVRSSADGRG